MSQLPTEIFDEILLKSGNIRAINELGTQIEYNKRKLRFIIAQKNLEKSFTDWIEGIFQEAYGDFE